MRLAQNQHRRAGFTLVELMVAMGLTILIMTVMASGFQMALQSFSHLKTATELSDRMRTAETMLRRDLEAEHFDSGPNPGVLRLSDLRLDRDPTVRPAGGFVQIRQPSRSTVEGGDADNLSSTIDVNHGLSLTVRRSGKTAGDLFDAPLAAGEPMTIGGSGVGVIATNPMDVWRVPNTYYGEWAEVCWFLDTTRPTVQNGVNTYPLIRRVRLLTPNAVTRPAADGPTLPEVVSARVSGGNITTNTLAAVANPFNRLGSTPTPAVFGPPTALPSTSARYGDDIVITNVVGFEVKPTWEPAAGGAPPQFTVPGLRLNGDYPFDIFPPALNATVFDTAIGGFSSTIAVPQPTVTPARVTGVQVKIRIYDGKNKMTRQSVVTSKL